MAGETRACACPDGTASTQLCLGDRFTTCGCETPPDAGNLDGGTAPACAACGCGAPPIGLRIVDPPPIGRVATVPGGREVFVLRDGYVVRADDGIILFDRDGTRLHRHDAVVLDADVVGERVYYRTAESIVALDPLLIHRGEARLQGPCAYMVALECERVLCVGEEIFDEAVVYDLVSGAATSTPSRALPPVSLVRLEGRDTVVDQRAWRRIDARGVVHGYSLPMALQGLLGIGWPAHTVVAQDGMSYDARGCGAPTYADGPLPPGCGAPLGPIGLPDSGEALGLLAASPEGSLVAVTNGARGANVVMMDVTTRTVLARVPMPPLTISLDGLAHDPRLGRHVIWGRACESCALEIIAFDDGVP